MLRNGEIQVALMTGTEELEKDSNFHVEEILHRGDLSDRS